jgi:hypothetical protein
MNHRLTPYESALSAIVDESNKHRKKGKACRLVGYAGGRSRYIWLTLSDHADEIIVTLFGNEIAVLTPEAVTLDPCGEFTPCTRDAFASLMGYCTLTLPGSKGGPNDGPWTATVAGVTFSERVTIPNRQAVAA